MKIAIVHGYELTGSGSNEYTRYLARALATRGHDVHLVCRESRAAHDLVPGATIHQLPPTPVHAVFLTDKQRTGQVKAFPNLTDQELDEYHRIFMAALKEIFAKIEPDLVHANHVVWAPVACADAGYPFIVYPHGSAIEYVVRNDDRCREAAGRALRAARGLIPGSAEVRDRILDLYPDDREALLEKTEIVGVGVDTALFQPVARDERRTSLAHLAGSYGGKTKAQRTELTQLLDGDAFDAVTQYMDAYDHGAPDAELFERLDALDWDNGKFLLFVGALTAGKGLQGLLAALPAVLKEHPDTHLLVVGSGAYREVLEGLVHAIGTGNQQLFTWLSERGFDLDRSDVSGSWPDVHGDVPTHQGLGEHVHFLGRLDHDLLCRLFPCVDLAVFPSVIPEAYPLVLMEALSNGVLPVVSDFSGFSDGLATLEPLLGRELVDRMRLPVDADRVQGIAVRLLSLLGSGDLGGDLGTRLRSIAVEHFDWSVRAEQMTAVYARFLRNSRNTSV